MDNRMERIVALAKRRGFIFQSSEIYGGLQGFWDYGPLGMELKRNVREAWYRDMVTYHNELVAPEGAPRSFSMVGLESTIIMHPQVWKCSGHYDLFHDMMVDCRETKSRYRADHISCHTVTVPADGDGRQEIGYVSTLLPAPEFREQQTRSFLKRVEKAFDCKNPEISEQSVSFTQLSPDDRAKVMGPEANSVGTLTDPREFNLMFKTVIGALSTEAEGTAFLRPETAQGMFVNFKNVLDSSRVKVPFGIAQIGKSFRNEITPRNYIFRSREFEQMEMEFFCHPEESRKWYEYWRDRRFQWYQDLGIAKENLILRDHTPEELAHYSVGTADVEYAFPFLDEGEYGELEGIAHRGNFDLRSHIEGKLVKDAEGNLIVEKDENGNPKYRGSGKDLVYLDEEAFERDKEGLGVKSFKAYAEGRKNEADPGAPYRFIPHVIEPAAGADRTTLAFLCEAYHEDQQPDEKGKMQERVVMRLHPRLAPIKAAVFPLIKKEGMPEKAAEIYQALKKAGIASFYDQQGAIGRRYRRQDEIGTPYCLTVDGDTASDNCVTLRDRDSLNQERVPVDEVVARIRASLEA